MAPPAKRRRHLATWTVFAYGLTMFGSTALHSCFMTYYVDFFRTKLQVSSSAFVWSQIAFGLWNAVNDPLFGWLSDVAACKGTPPLRRRAIAIAVGGLVWGSAFLSVWWPWGDGGSMEEAAHMTFALCAYDAALTWVEVNHGAALAELTLDQGDRARANAWSGLCAAVGAGSSWCAHLVWSDAEGLVAFRSVCLGAAAAATAAFMLSGAGLALADGIDDADDDNASAAAAAAVEEGLDEDDDVSDEDTVDRSTPGSTVAVRPRRARRPTRSSQATLSHAASDATSNSASSGLCGLQACLFARQILSSSSFRIFALVAGVQAFDCAFEKNFFGTFLERLAGGDAEGDAAVPAEARAAVVSASFLLPHVVTVALTPAIRSVGLHALLTRIFGVRLVLLGTAAAAVLLPSALLLAASSSLPPPLRQLLPPPQWVAAGFLLVNRVSSECVCRLFPVVVGDLTDEHAATHPHDSLSRAATVVGASLFLGRLLSGAAPILGFAVLRRLEASSPNELQAAGSGGVAESHVEVWQLLVLVPLACVLVQALLWPRFQLRGQHLRDVKHAAAERRKRQQRQRQALREKVEGGATVTPVVAAMV